MRRLQVHLLSLCALLAAVGCGEGGAASGATVSVYVSAPLRGDLAASGRRLCEEAREGAAEGHGSEELKLRVVCLDSSGSDASWTLARVGANARRATEDSTAVAYVGEPDPRARRQSQPLLESAGIADLEGAGGKEAIARVRAALRDSGTDNPRQAVFDAVEG